MKVEQLVHGNEPQRTKWYLKVPYVVIYSGEARNMEHSKGIEIADNNLQVY